MTDVARPAHLADVHEAFDARLELDERAVVRDRDDLAVTRVPTGYFSATSFHG